MKICKICNNSKEDSEFNLNKVNNKFYLNSYCIQCTRDLHKQRYLGKVKVLKYKFTATNFVRELNILLQERKVKDIISKIDSLEITKYDEYLETQVFNEFCAKLEKILQESNVLRSNYIHEVQIPKLNLYISE